MGRFPSVGKIFFSRRASRQSLEPVGFFWLIGLINKNNPLSSLILYGAMRGLRPLIVVY
jgi:hypothetical protein